MRLPIAIIAALMLTGCYNKASDAPLPEKPLARVGSEILTRREVAATVPSGLADNDSLEYVRQYVNRWVDRQLIDQAASTVLDMDDIERRVEKYRLDLISAEYRRYRFEQRGDSTFSPEQMRSYYDSNKELFTSGHPMVKGIYLKVPDNAARLGEIRRLLQRGSKADIDRLEGLVAGTAIHYDYFRDQWVEWRRIEQLIPTRFASEPMAVLRDRKLLDISLGGFTYLLKVDSYLPGDSPLPYEQAIPQIQQRLTNRERMKFDATFQQRLRQEAEKQGQIEINL